MKYLPWILQKYMCMYMFIHKKVVATPCVPILQLLHLRTRVIAMHGEELTLTVCMYASMYKFKATVKALRHYSVFL